MIRLWVIFLLSVAAIQASRTIGAFGGASDRALEQLRYLLWSLMVAPGMIFAWGADYALNCRRFVSRGGYAGRLLGLTMALVPMAVFYGVLGFMLGNSTRYTLGDTYKALLTPFGFYIAAVGVRTLRGANRMLQGLAIFGFYPGLDVGSNVFTVGYLTGRKVVYWRRYSWLLLLPILFIGISERRTSLLIFPFVVVLMYFYARRLSVFRMLLVGAGAVGLVLALLQVAPKLITDAGAYWKTALMIRKFDLLDYRLLDPSTYQRVQEAVLVGQKFMDHTLVEGVFGFGSGAEFKVTGLPLLPQRYWMDAHGGYAHNIHLSPVFVYHLWGLPGLLHLSYTILTVAGLGGWLARRRHWGADPRLRERYSLLVASYLMIVGFLLYGGWNPPKINLLYLGLVFGTMWRLLGSDVTRGTPGKITNGGSRDQLDADVAR